MNPCTAKLDLYLTQRKALINYAAAIVGCRDQAERLVQEAWLRFGVQQGEVRPSGLFRIVRNLARARVRPPVLAVVEPAPASPRASVLHGLVAAAARLRWPARTLEVVGGWDSLRQRLQA